MSAPKVLLVEDDSSIARFVQMALEELPIELVTCANVPDAMQALHAGGVELIITDLMLPGESGIDLVQRLLQEPVQGRRIPVAVFSAGLTPPVREQLQAMKVWRMVSKPASVAELEACVTDALALVAEPPPLPTRRPQAPRWPMTRPTMRRRPLPPTLRAMSFCSRPTAPAACSSSRPTYGKATPPARRKTGPRCGAWHTASPPCCSPSATQPRACAPASWKTRLPSLPPRRAWNIGACCGRSSCSSDPVPAALQAHRVALQILGSGRSPTQPPPPENAHPIGGQHHLPPQITIQSKK